MEIEKGTQLKGYIQRETKANGITSNYGYKYYFCRGFLERLFNIEPKKFILKGSFSQFINIGKIIRPLTDIDIIVNNNIVEANDVLIELIQTAHKVKYTIKQSFITTNATINYRILCQFDDVQHLITVDLRKEEGLERVNKPLPILFSKDYKIYTNSITLEEHLANKIYISILNLQLNLQLGKEFRRFKDFYDIYGILELGEIDEKKLSNLLEAKIKNDNFLSKYNINGNLFTKKFILENNRAWKKNAEKYNFKYDIEFEETVERTNGLISRIRK